MKSVFKEESKYNFYLKIDITWSNIEMLREGVTVFIRKKLGKIPNFDFSKMFEL